MLRTNVSVRLFSKAGGMCNSAELNPGLRIDTRIYINNRYRYIKTDQHGLHRICDNISHMVFDSTKHIKPLRLKGLPADLRDQIKQARAQRGWGQRELGAAVGLPQPHISAIESGGIVPRYDTLLDVVRVLDMDLLLVPRSLVPAVQSLIRAQKEPESVEKSLYAVDEEESEPGKRDHDEF
jgi:transcriptional regulator with XRE-family HTH domain